MKWLNREVSDRQFLGWLIAGCLAFFGGIGVSLYAAFPTAPAASASWFDIKWDVRNARQLQYDLIGVDEAHVQYSIDVAEATHDEFLAVLIANGVSADDAWAQLQPWRDDIRWIEEQLTLIDFAHIQPAENHVAGGDASNWTIGWTHQYNEALHHLNAGEGYMEQLLGGQADDPNDDFTSATEIVSGMQAEMDSYIADNVDGSQAGYGGF